MEELKPKLLITGASGLLGTRLTNFLKENQQFNIITHALKNKADINFDLTHKEETFKYLDQELPQIIVNLVALTNVDRCEEDLELATKLNVTTLENLSEWAKKNNAFLLNISTDQVYSKEGPFKEDEILPINVYGKTKQIGERLVSHVQGVNLRTNFFGKSHPGTKNSFSDWLIEAMNSETPINLFTDIHFSPLSLTTLCECILLVLNKKIPGTFNLGSHDGLSKRDFAIELAKTLKLSTKHCTDSKSLDHGLKALRPKDMRLDSTLFEQTYLIKLPTLINEIEKEYGE